MLTAYLPDSSCLRTDGLVAWRRHDPLPMEPACCCSTVMSIMIGAEVHCVPQIREANQMVEEMMLLANVTVAEHTLSAFPSCSLLRSHATPAPKRFQPLVQAGSAAGFEIDFSSSKVSFQTCHHGSRRASAVLESRGLQKSSASINIALKVCSTAVSSQKELFLLLSWIVQSHEVLHVLAFDQLCWLSWSITR